MKGKFKFISKTRIIVAVAVSIALVFYFFNFIPRDITILASRSFGRQILDYLLNFCLFFIIVYLLSSLPAFMLARLHKHRK
jgi:O-antigen/teichoic acid export membrane protein